jgi:hypothetical protein
MSDGDLDENFDQLDDEQGPDQEFDDPTYSQSQAGGADDWQTFSQPAAVEPQRMYMLSGLSILIFYLCI